jgi:hypothetical protein
LWFNATPPARTFVLIFTPLWLSWTPPALTFVRIFIDFSFSKGCSMPPRTDAWRSRLESFLSQRSSSHGDFGDRAARRGDQGAGTK